MSANNNIENNKKLKENPFIVPANYFEELDNKLASIAQEKAKVIQLSSRKRIYRFVSIAATFIILITAGYLISIPSADATPELTQEEILLLVDKGYLEPSEFVLLEVVSIDELNTIDDEKTDLYEYYEYTQPDVIEDYYLYDNI